MSQAIPVATVVTETKEDPSPSVEERVSALKRQFMGMPAGIAEQFAQSAGTFAQRYFIVDNSGSMSLGDGHKLLATGGKTAMVSCSRWQEIGETLKYLGQVAVTLRAPTEFRLLNPPTNGSAQVVRIGYGGRDELRDVDEMIASRPTGRTPLCAAVRAVSDDIFARRTELLHSGKRVAVIIASDGEASDGNVANALRPLRDLPCWVVIRLCTDDDSVVSYWNGVDDELELDLDVLDDLHGEAKEVHAFSPFLTYGLALHRLREFGTAVKLFDILDERKLKTHELLDLVTLIFGTDAKEFLPHPDLSFSKFLKGLDHIQKTRKKDFPPVLDPIKARVRPWFDVKKIGRAHVVKSCAIM